MNAAVVCAAGRFADREARPGTPGAPHGTVGATVPTAQVESADVDPLLIDVVIWPL